MAFHRTSLAAMALFGNLSNWPYRYQELENTYPVPTDYPNEHHPDVEIERQNILAKLAKPSTFLDLSQAIREANDWLEARVQALSQESIAAPLWAMLPSATWFHTHGRCALFERIGMICARVFAKPIYNGFPMITPETVFLLLTARCFSTMKADKRLTLKYIKNHAEKRFEPDSHRHLLDYADRLPHKSKTTLRTTLLKHSETMHQRVEKEIHSPSWTAWHTEAYSSYVARLPRGAQRGRLQADLFLWRLTLTGHPQHLLESHFLFELDDVPSKTRQNLCSAATLALALRGNAPLASLFLSKITAPKVRNELMTTLMHFSQASAAAERKGWPFSEIFSASCPEGVREIIDGFFIANAEGQEALNTFLSSLWLCNPELLLAAAMCAVNARSDGFILWLCNLIDTTTIPASYDPIDLLAWVYGHRSHHDTPPPIDLIGKWLAVYRDFSSKRLDLLLTALSRHMLRPQRFLYEVFEGILQGKNSLHLLKAIIEHAPFDLSNAVYRDLLAAIYKKFSKNSVAIATLRKAVFQHHAQLRFLPTSYYDLSDELLLPLGKRE